MNLKRVLKFCFVFSIFLGGVKMTLMTSAKVARVRSSSSFNKALDRAPFNIVMMYELDKGMRKKNRKIYDQMVRMEKLFKDASENPYLKTGNVQFIAANVAQENLEAEVNEFQVTEFPTFILFKDDKPLQGARLTGFLGAQEIQEFIHNHFDKDIQRIIKRKKELAELREAQRQANQPAIGFYAGYGPGYYGPYYGGWGWGGYPYYEGYGGYGPGFGISFGF